MSALCGARRIRGMRRRNWPSSSGSQLVEFALALPILLLLVVGIWDFGSAFALKQKLTNAAREGDRIVVSTPISNPTGASGCSQSVPCSIVSSATAVRQYLTNASLNASWVNPSSPSSSASCPAGEWFYGTAGTGPSLDIKSGVWIAPSGSVVAANGSVPVGSVKATQVTVTWPLQWKLASFLPSGTLPDHVSATVTMVNLGGGCGDSIQ